MFVLLLMFFPVSLSQVPITHYTQHLTLLIHTCRLHTHGVSRKVRRGLSHLLKARCLHRACRKNQTVIFVLPRSASSPIPGRVRGRSSVMTKRREMATAIPAVSRIMIPRRNNVRQLDTMSLPVRPGHMAIIPVPLTVLIIRNVFVTSI